MARTKKVWWIYLLRCADGTLYCGIALDVEQRLAAHNLGRGARYTRGRGPCAVVHREGPRTHGQALRREYEIKMLPRSAKQKLAAGGMAGIRGTPSGTLHPRDLCPHRLP